MKKIAYIIGFLLMIGIVSAYVPDYYPSSSTSLGYNLGHGMAQLIDGFEGLVGPLFSVFLGGSGDLLFERVLFFLIIFSTVFVIIGKNVKIFENKTALIWIVSLSVSLLSTRFLTDTQLVKSIILPYSVLGVALTAILPTIIYFYFVWGFKSISARKILWIFYGVVYISLWATRIDEVGQVSWIYFWTAMMAFLLFLMDGTIRRWMVMGDMRRVNQDKKDEYIMHLNKELDIIRNNEKHYPTPGSFRSAKMKVLRKIASATKARIQDIDPDYKNLMD